MATVRMSVALKDSVVSKIRIANRNRYDQLKKSYLKKLNPEALIKDATAAWAEDLGISDIMHRFPDSWRKDYTELTIQTINGASCNNTFGSLKFETPQRLPYLLVNPVGNNHAYYRGITLQNPVFDTYKTIIEEADAALKDVANKNHDAENQVRRILDSSNTLQQALKVWPGIEALVPDEYMEQYHSKVERIKPEQKKREELGVDLDTLNSVHVLNTIASAL